MRKFIDTIYLRKQKQSDQLRFYVFPRTNSTLALTKAIFTRAIVFLLIAALSYNFYITFTPFTSAAFNEQINYQGKLTDANDIPVADGSYNMRFQLCTVSDCTGGSDPIWTETHCYSPDSGSTCNGTGTDQRISVASGLFSVLMGSITSLSSVDFNQTLYLEVQIGGTSASSPSWETLTPRKTLGAVPAAFEAGQLDGIDSASFARSDAADTISGLFTITKVPAGTGVSQGSLYINPASATADYTLLGLAVSGSEKFKIDEDGEVVTGIWTATDVGLAYGGTGASLIDPDADRIFFWDDSATTTDWLTFGSTLSITATSIDVVDLSCTNCLDFTEFENTLDLDANLTLNQSTNTWTQNFTGTTTTGFTYNANSLTSGTALSIASTSIAGAGSGSSKLLDFSRSGANTNTSHTASTIRNSTK